MATIQTGFAVAPIGDIEQGEVSDGRVRHKVREHFGIEAFGVNAFRAVEAGAQLINEHNELGVASPGQQELYVVLSGQGAVHDRRRRDRSAGRNARLRRANAKRGAVADEQDTTVLVVGGTPGVAYNQSPGFLVGPMFGPYGEGDFAGAAAIVREVLKEHPGLPLGALQPRVLRGPPRRERRRPRAPRGVDRRRGALQGARARRR